MMNRRVFVMSSACLAMTGWAGCRNIATRESVLRQLVLQVAVPELQALPKVSRELASALHQVKHGDAASLENAQRALRKALLAWQRVQAFRNGPVVESNALLRSTFWPARRLAIGSVIEGNATIHSALVESLGVDAKGLFALELMLFEQTAREEWLGPHGERVIALAAAFADDVRERADAVLRQLGDGRAFADKFAAGGQESLNRLVNQLVETSETIAADRLLRVLGLQEHDRLLPGQIYGGFSGLSAQLPLASLITTQSLYLGVDDAGLCALVKQVSPAIDTRVRSTFAAALAALKALSGPLEQVVRRDRKLLVQAADAAKALEVALKSDLASALGVTLSIVSGDGD